MKTLLILCTIIITHIAVAQQIKNQPQTLKPPFDYHLDSVEYDNADKSIHFGATFTYPKTAKPFCNDVADYGKRFAE